MDDDLAQVALETVCWYICHVCRDDVVARLRKNRHATKQRARVARRKWEQLQLEVLRCPLCVLSYLSQFIFLLSPCEQKVISKWSKPCTALSPNLWECRPRESSTLRTTRRINDVQNKQMYVDEHIWSNCCCARPSSLFCPGAGALSLQAASRCGDVSGGDVIPPKWM